MSFSFFVWFGIIIDNASFIVLWICLSYTLTSEFQSSFKNFFVGFFQEFIIRNKLNIQVNENPIVLSEV